MTSKVSTWHQLKFEVCSMFDASENVSKTNSELQLLAELSLLHVDIPVQLRHTTPVHLLQFVQESALAAGTVEITWLAKAENSTECE